MQTTYLHNVQCCGQNAVSKMLFTSNTVAVAAAAAASLTCSLEWKWIVFNDYTFSSGVHVQYERLSNNHFFVAVIRTVRNASMNELLH